MRSCLFIYLFIYLFVYMVDKVAFINYNVASHGSKSTTFGCLSLIISQNRKLMSGKPVIVVCNFALFVWNKCSMNGNEMLDLYKCSN